MICCCKLVGFKMQSIPDEFCFKVIMFFFAQTDHHEVAFIWSSTEKEQ